LSLFVVAANNFLLIQPSTYDRFTFKKFFSTLMLRSLWSSALMAFCSLVVAATNSPTAADEVLGLKTSSSAEQPNNVGGITVASTQTVLTYSSYPTGSRRETVIPPPRGLLPPSSNSNKKLTEPEAATAAVVIPSLSLNVVRDSPGFSPIKTATTTIGSTPRRPRRAPTLTNNYGFSSAGLSSATSSGGGGLERGQRRQRQRVVLLADESERSGEAKFPLGSARVSPSHNEITRRIRFDKPRRLGLGRRREKRFTGENVKNDRLTFRHKEEEDIEDDKRGGKKTNVGIRPSSSSKSESKALVSAGVGKDKARANPVIRTEISSIMPFTAAEIYQQQRQHIEKPIVSKATTTSPSSSLSSRGKSRIRSSGIKDQQFPRMEARFELFSRTSSEEKPRKKVKPTAAAITSASTPRPTKAKIIKTKTTAKPTTTSDDNYSCTHLLNNRPVDEWSSTATGQLSFHCSSAPKIKRSPNSTELELPQASNGGVGNKEVKKKLLDQVGVTVAASAMDHHQLHQWPIKLSAEVEGDLILGGLMMVHEREDSVTCGPVMPQGGVQALEAMLYTLDKLNAEKFVPGVKVGAHILDDCDKDTYGLEMAVDFIKASTYIWSESSDQAQQTLVRHQYKSTFSLRMKGFHLLRALSSLSTTQYTFLFYTEKNILTSGAHSQSQQLELTNALVQTRLTFTRLIAPSETLVHRSIIGAFTLAALHTKSLAQLYESSSFKRIHLLLFCCNVRSAAAATTTPSA
ncbi:unnamed protein product, partial [Trichogramma brassicae]